jgi:hypothetical protein
VSVRSPFLLLPLLAVVGCAPQPEPPDADPSIPREATCAANLGSRAVDRVRLRSVKVPSTGEVGQPFRLLDPVGTASWARESLHSIMWSTGGVPANGRVAIDQSGDGGGSWSRVDVVAAAQGRVVWTVPADGPATRRFRLTSSWDGSTYMFDVNLTPSQKASYRWVCVTDKTPFTQRDGAGALVYHDRMWLIGGWNPTIMPRFTANDVWSTTDGVNWVNDKPQTFVDTNFDGANDWEGRHTAGYAVFDDKMWIVGGDPLQAHYQGDVWSSTDGKKWTRATQFAPWGNRALHYTLAFNDHIWVLGGQTMTDFVSSKIAPYQVFNDVWSSKNGIEWTQTQTVGPMWQPRATIQQSAVLNGRMWVIAGGTYNSYNEGITARQYFMDVWSSADGASWTRESVTTPWSARQYQSVVAWDGKLWVISGYNEEGNLDGGWYSADGKNWYPTDTPWDPRHAASVWVYKDAVWMTGGGDIDVWRIERK